MCVLGGGECCTGGKVQQGRTARTACVVFCHAMQWSRLTSHGMKPSFRPMLGDRTSPVPPCAKCTYRFSNGKHACNAATPTRQQYWAAQWFGSEIIHRHEHNPWGN